MIIENKNKRRRSTPLRMPNFCLFVAFLVSASVRRYTQIKWESKSAQRNIGSFSQTLAQTLLIEVAVKKETQFICKVFSERMRFITAHLLQTNSLCLVDFFIFNWSHLSGRKCIDSSLSVLCKKKELNQI